MNIELTGDYHTDCTLLLQEIAHLEAQLEEGKKWAGVALEENDCEGMHLGGNTPDWFVGLAAFISDVSLDKVSKRYSVKEGSETSHCCFEWTVLDKYDIHTIECYEEKTAILVANALNKKKEYRFCPLKGIYKSTGNEHNFKEIVSWKHDLQCIAGLEQNDMLLTDEDLIHCNNAIDKLNAKLKSWFKSKNASLVYIGNQVITK